MDGKKEERKEARKAKSQTKKHSTDMAVGASNSSRECVHLYTAQIPDAAQRAILEEIESLNERSCLKFLRVRVAIKMPNIFPQLPHEHIQGSTPLQLPKYIYMLMYIPHSFTHTLGTHVNSLHTHIHTDIHTLLIFTHTKRHIQTLFTHIHRVYKLQKMKYYS